MPRELHLYRSLKCNAGGVADVAILITATVSRPPPLHLKEYDMFIEEWAKSNDMSEGIINTWV